MLGSLFELFYFLRCEIGDLMGFGNCDGMMREYFLSLCIGFLWYLFVKVLCGDFVL